MWDWILEGCSFCDWQHEVAGCGTGYWRGARFVTGNMWLLPVDWIRDVAGDKRLLSAPGIHKRAGSGTYMRVLIVKFDT